MSIFAVLAAWMRSPPSNTAWCAPISRQAVIAVKWLRRAEARMGALSWCTTGNCSKLGSPSGCCTACTRVSVCAGVSISWPPSSTRRVIRAPASAVSGTETPAPVLAASCSSALTRPWRSQSHTPIRLRSAGSIKQLRGTVTKAALGRPTRSTRPASSQPGAPPPSSTCNRKDWRCGQPSPKPTYVTQSGLGWASGSAV